MFERIAYPFIDNIKKIGVAALGLETDPKIVAAGIVAYHETKKAYLVPFQDTVPTLLALRDSGYKIGIVTDGVPVKQWEKIIRLGLKDFFHKVVVAAEGTEQKPSPGPFLLAAAGIGAAPKDCMVVGDRIDKDILGGRRAGMTTVQIVKAQHFPRPPTVGGEPDYIISSLKDILRILATRRPAS